MKQPTKNSIKGDLTETYNLLYTMFRAAYMELRDLTKKAPKRH